MANVRITLVSLMILINCVVLSVSLLNRPHRKDVCEPNPRAFDPKIVCHCQQLTTNGRVSEYKRADCWLHGSDLTDYDEAWDGFGRSANIKELSFVVFTDDQLKFLPQKGMYYLSDYLTIFSLSHADIPLIHSYAFSKLDKLEEISLMANNISTLEDYAFLKLEHLKTLNLSFNQITHIDRHVFYQNYRLELLHLSVNNITTISDKAFADLNSLIELRMDFNMIQRLTSDMLVGLTSLVKLVLTANYISVIDGDTLEHMPALEYLDLSQNSLQFIAENALRRNSRLKFIDLEQNELKHLDANLFHSLPNLRHVNVGKNLLMTLEVDKHRFMIERFINETTVLFMHENNFVCDCRLLWLYELRNRTRSGSIQKSLDNLNCDLKERDEKPEQVFLLRLHYENFDCESIAETPTTDFSVSARDSRLRDNHNYYNNYRGSASGLRIFRSGILLSLLSTCMLARKSIL